MQFNDTYEGIPYNPQLVARMTEPDFDTLKRLWFQYRDAKAGYLKRTCCGCQDTPGWCLLHWAFNMVTCCWGWACLTGWDNKRYVAGPRGELVGFLQDLNSRVRLNGVAVTFVEGTNHMFEQILRIDINPGIVPPALRARR